MQRIQEVEQELTEEGFFIVGETGIIPVQDKPPTGPYSLGKKTPPHRTKEDFCKHCSGTGYYTSKVCEFCKGRGIPPRDGELITRLRLLWDGDQMQDQDFPKGF